MAHVDDRVDGYVVRLHDVAAVLNEHLTDGTGVVRFHREDAGRIGQVCRVVDQGSGALRCQSAGNEHASREWLACEGSHQSLQCTT